MRSMWARIAARSASRFSSAALRRAQAASERSRVRLSMSDRPFDFVVAFLPRPFARGGPGRPSKRDARTALEQHRRDLSLAPSCGIPQGRGAILFVDGVDIGAVIQQEPCLVDVSLRGGVMQ